MALLDTARRQTCVSCQPFSNSLHVFSKHRNAPSSFWKQAAEEAKRLHTEIVGDDALHVVWQLHFFLHV